MQIAALDVNSSAIVESAIGMKNRPARDIKRPGFEVDCAALVCKTTRDVSALDSC